LLSVLAACAPQMDPEVPGSLLTSTTSLASSPSVILPTGTPSPTAQVDLPADRSDRLLTPPPSGLERVPTLPAPVIGEVPQDLLDAILSDLQERHDIDPEAVTIIRAESITWSDGSLGCPQPGVMYTQALVDGYWIVLEVDGKQYDYRASQSGYFTLCGEGLPKLLTPPVEGGQQAVDK
ncbi:MAG: hypothetical protein PVG32_20970, partial [Anaerolineales bacterium]